MRIKFLFLSICFFSINFNYAQIITLPDNNLKSYLLLSDTSNQIAEDLNGNFIKIDANNDGEIQQTEADQVVILGIDPFSYGINISINSLSGLESFSNLTELNLVYLFSGTNLAIQDLTSLEILRLYSFYNQPFSLNNLPNLRELDISDFQPLNLDFSSCNCGGLEKLSIQESTIDSIDLSEVPNLINFGLYFVELDVIDLSHSFNLEQLNLNGTQINQLDLSQNLNLKNIGLYFNGNLDVDLSVLENLEGIAISDTNIPTVDLSNSPNFSNFLTQWSNINFLNFKNGTEASSLSVQGGTINYICADDFEIDTIIQSAAGSNIQSINSYCSFNPGGDYYTVEGENRVDGDLDGCEPSDSFYPNLRFDIANVDNNWTYYSNSTGSFFIPLSEGDHSINPVIVENPTYFNPSPISANVSFPTDASPYELDFCLVPNGTFNDLEVVVIPNAQAIPGFDVQYIISYKNKGNTVISGSIEFDYSASANFVELLSANPDEDSEMSNILSWNFTDLLPFETREIIVDFELNTPVDPIYPLNSGDELGFASRALPLANDETPDDNEFDFKHEVVNSFDPNDITCLEGEELLVDDVGKYVHYLIRFENLGTANAMNVVINNNIDTTKFDIETLIPLSGSHSYYTRINENNDVEFIFENIQLPFDDANNDGYVLYKIRTLNNLVLGDELANQAGIYFDFNAPIITNNYITEIVDENLSITDYSTSEVKIFPNPVTDVLNVQTEMTIEAIRIFDLNGRVVLNSGMDVNDQIDLQILDPGIYFLELNSKDSMRILKLIKQ